MQSFLQDVRSSLGLQKVAGTRCRTVRRHLSALQDGELAPSERARVEEHLDRCPTCAWRLQRLGNAVPKPFIVVPDPVRQQLDETLQLAIEREFERLPQERHTHARAMPSWLADPLPIPRIAIVAYAALLVATLGWGVTTWMGSSATQPLGTETAVASSPTAPVSHYRPASFVPTEDWF